jgi:hypothetical protein
MAEFLGMPTKTMRQLAWGDRVPLPIPLGGTMRWNVLELLLWVQAGCPCCTDWLRMLRKSGSFGR